MPSRKRCYCPEQLKTTVVRCRNRRAAAGLLKVIMDRLGTTVSPAGVRAYLDLAAIAMSGRAQEFRAIIWLYGKSGVEKGSASKLLVQSFGDRGATAELRLLEREARSDIDADMANLIINRPLVVGFAELHGRVTARRSKKLATPAPTVGPRSAAHPLHPAPASYAPCWQASQNAARLATIAPTPPPHWTNWPASAAPTHPKTNPTNSGSGWPPSTSPTAPEASLS